MSNAIINVKPLGFQWETRNPFLFCVHHLDSYPKGNGSMGPDVSLQGRNLGNDFTIKDGFRMYHGDVVPGFPCHPHRGFETVTIVLEGVVDHSDSLGAAGRYGYGDVQWMTAGKGLQHSEMFPCLNKDKPNALELFQIWLNSPSVKKMVNPYYKMLWRENIPKISVNDSKNRTTEITLISGNYRDTMPEPPVPDSWAADPANEVCIWLIKMAGDAEFTLKPASSGLNRSLYFYRGNSLNINEQLIDNYHSVDLRSDEEVSLQNGNEEAFLLFLQGKPIEEPVVQYGPFVMNSKAEIQQAYADFQKDEFGGWPWPGRDNVHNANKGRFARYSDGREEVKNN